MNNILNFIKYHNLFTIILGGVLLATAGAFANEEIRGMIVGEEITTVQGVDNSWLLAADLDNFDMAFQIQNVAEDENNYYLPYSYKTLVIKENVWQEVLKENTLNVPKTALAGRELENFVSEELGEVADYELRQLKEAQRLEKEKGVQNLTVSVQYAGLRGLILDFKNKIFRENNVQSSLNQESEPASVGQAAVEQVVAEKPETFIESPPPSLTFLTEAQLTFRSDKEGASFQCKLNFLDWAPCESPKQYVGLAPGDYAFQVYAVDSQGSYDATPASFVWTIIAP